MNYYLGSCDGVWSIAKTDYRCDGSVIFPTPAEAVADRIKAFVHDNNYHLDEIGSNTSNISKLRELDLTQ